MSYFQKYNFSVAERENLLSNLGNSELSGYLAGSDMGRNLSAVLMCGGLGILTVAPEFVDGNDQAITVIYGTFLLIGGYVFGENNVADAHAAINVAKSRGLEILKNPFFRQIKLNSGN